MPELPSLACPQFQVPCISWHSLFLLWRMGVMAANPACSEGLLVLGVPKEIFLALSPSVPSLGPLVPGGTGLMNPFPDSGPLWICPNEGWQASWLHEALSLSHRTVVPPPNSAVRASTQSVLTSSTCHLLTSMVTPRPGKARCGGEETSTTQ